MPKERGTPDSDGLSLGVDLGGTNVRAAVVDREGRLRSLARARVDDARSSPRAVIERTFSVIREALGKAGIELAAIASVGVGVAAQVRGSTGVVALAPNLGWREVPLGRMLADALGRPVRVVNDLDAIAWGEVCFGAARGHQDVLVVYCGTGVGGGLVLGGRPYHGPAGVAGEIGHVKVRPADGAACGCGSTGCLEAYLGGRNLSERLRREAADWPELYELAGGDPHNINPGLVERLVEQGDERAGALWRELAGMLGDVLANAVTLLNLSAVVLGGTVLYGCPGLHRKAREVLKQRVLAVAGESLAILDDQLGDRAGIVGAASL